MDERARVAETMEQVLAALRGQMSADPFHRIKIVALETNLAAVTKPPKADAG
jgi:hypothetical protein